jgi:hypothetical protein
MRWVAIAFVFIFIAALVFFQAKPGLLLEASDAMTQSWLYGVAAVRVVFGLVLIAAAGASRFPRTLRVLSTLVILGGILAPLIGVDGIHAILDSFGRDVAFIRIGGMFALILCLFILFALTSRRKDT